MTIQGKIAGHGSRVASPLAILLLSALFCAAQDAPPIPESEIVALEQLLRDGAAGDARTGVASRRAFKNATRKGLALVETYPEAPNRFRALGIVAQCQKRMFAIAETDKNREALFKACERLVNAPDEYAEERLEAELLLSERDLSGKDATLAERAEVLAELIARYRGTTAEARSLLVGALIVQKLDARELESQILDALDERFSDDHQVMAFRRKLLSRTRLDLVFAGEHKRIDGSRIVFPSDTLGHMCLIVFWSKNKPGVETYLAMMKEGLEKTSGAIDVFSFNVDELPDGGESVLQEHGLDWTVMMLPGGRRNQAYRSYAQADPVSVLVNEYGMAVTRAESQHGRTSSLDESRISENRYMVQLQSLFIGDFLLFDSSTLDVGSSSSSNALNSIQSCFVPPPFRYRLTREESLRNYRRAVELAVEMLRQAQHDRKLTPSADSGVSSRAQSRDLVLARNARIVALMGLWNTACEPKYLEEAVAEAETALVTKLPAAGYVVPRFCLARAALRADDVEEESVVVDFLKACGGTNAPASALAAAAVLAIDAKSRELYDQYRSAFLDAHGSDPTFYSFSAFLRDRHHQYRLLKANHTLRERRARGSIVGHGYPWPTNSLPDLEFENLDGSRFSMPKDTNGKLTYLLFVEPPAGGGTNNWSITRDSRGNVRHASGVHTVMGYANKLTKTHLNSDINFVAAFLTDDVNHVKYLVATNGWDCKAVTVPGGLKNPMVRQLGVLSADSMANVFLLRRDGTIVWNKSGLKYCYGDPFAVLLALKVHVEVCELEHAYRALVEDDFKEAVRVFSGPFPEENPQRYAWRPVRYHGLALSHVGLKQWDDALKAVDMAIEAHKLRHFHGLGRRSKLIAEWRKDAAKVEIKEPCDVICDLWATKAAILDQLGRKDEAATLRKRSAKPVQEHSLSVYELFHQKLKAIEGKLGG
jgi:hypothetical protein